MEGTQAAVREMTVVITRDACLACRGPVGGPYTCLLGKTCVTGTETSRGGGKPQLLCLCVCVCVVYTCTWVCVCTQRKIEVSHVYSITGGGRLLSRLSLISSPDTQRAGAKQPPLEITPRPNLYFLMSQVFRCSH